MKPSPPPLLAAVALGLCLLDASASADPPPDAALDASATDATLGSTDVSDDADDALDAAPAVANDASDAASDDAQSLASDITDAAPAPAAEPTDEAPSLPEVTAPETRLDVASYTLDARLDPQRHEVTGQGTLRWRNTSNVAVRDLWFHLYLNGFADERTVFMRSTGGEHRGNARGRMGRIDLRALALSTGEDLLATATNDPSIADDRSQLHVTLPREVAPGAEVTVSMAWTAVLPEVFARTGFKDSFHMVAQWFPKVAVLEADGRWAHFPFHGNSEFYADFGRYDVTLTVPRGYVVGATGQPVLTEHLADGERLRFSASPVHDFAWTAWDHFRERRDEAGDVALRVLYPPGYERAAELTVECLRRAMPAYEHRFGDYPYPNLTVVLPPRDAEGAGGMEYPTLITTGADWWTPEGVRDVAYVTLHEFMHQYFYGLVASNENAWPMLDEGFTEYATAAGLEDLYGHGGPFVDLPALGVRLEAFALESWWSGSIEHALPVARGAPDFPTFGDYGVHVYSRTATTLRTAENLVGRERFRLAMRAYVDAWRFRHPTPEDFFDSMRASLGAPIVDELLRPALERPVRVDYAIESATSKPMSGRHVGRVIVRRDGDLTLPVDVTLEDARGVTQTVRWNGDGGWVAIPYDGAAPLRAARVDAQGRIALDRDRINNAHLATDAPTRLPVSAVSRVAYWFGLVLQAVGP